MHAVGVERIHDNGATDDDVSDVKDPKHVCIQQDPGCVEGFARSESSACSELQIRRGQTEGRRWRRRRSTVSNYFA
eukprot:4897899-Pleurochrysis_carterae.AAC.2